MNATNPLIPAEDTAAHRLADDLIVYAARQQIELMKREAAFASVYQLPAMIRWFVRAIRREADLGNERMAMPRYAEIASLLIRLDELANGVEQDTLLVVRTLREESSL
jgi:hypothetical protein